MGVNKNKEIKMEPLSEAQEDLIRDEFSFGVLSDHRARFAQKLGVKNQYIMWEKDPLNMRASMNDRFDIIMDSWRNTKDRAATVEAMLEALSALGPITNNLCHKIKKTEGKEASQPDTGNSRSKEEV